MADATKVFGPQDGKSWFVGRYRRIAALAGCQHGVVARRQLLELGLGSDAIQYWLGNGRLHRVHRGVYAVGHRRLTRKGRWMAAVLACGPVAALSHRSAAALLGIRPPHSGEIEVTVGAWRPSRRGIRVHSGRISDDEVTVVDGIPVTTLPRTLFDLAGVVDRRRLEKAMQEADVRRLTDRLSLHDMIARYPRRKGSATIRGILRERDYDRRITRSELEEAFLAFIARAGLPEPELNASFELRGNWIEPDALWREQRVIAELDSYGFHGTRHSFESDRERDRILQTEGWRAVRITWRQLHDDANALEADLRRLTRAPSLPH